MGQEAGLRHATIVPSSLSLSRFLFVVIILRGARVRVADSCARLNFAPLRTMNATRGKLDLDGCVSGARDQRSDWK